MGKYSKAVIEDLLQNLDALDVLELIDYHPETIQRTGDTVQCYCPLSQDMSGRYLTVNLKTHAFESAAPHFPRQTGNLVDLYALCRRMSVDDAAKELADEFNIMLAEEGEEGAEGAPSLLEEAERFVKAAEAANEKRGSNVEEAEKRLRRLLGENKNNLDAKRVLFRLRILQANPLTLVPVTVDLMKALNTEETLAEAVAVGRRHLTVSANDILVRFQLAEALAAQDDRREAVQELMQVAEHAESTNQFDTALKAYRRVREIGDDLIDAHPMIVGLLQARGREDEAVAEMDAQIARLKDQGKFAEAVEEVQRKCDFRPNDADARLQLVEVASLGGLPDEMLDRCLAIVDGFLESEEYDRAAEALSYLSAEKPDNMLVLTMLINVYRRLDMNDVVAEFQLRLVQQHRQNDNAPEAYLILEEMLAENPSDVRLLKTMSELLIEDKSVNEAMVMLGKLLELQRRGGEFEEALGTVRQILELEPARAGAREMEIELLLQLNRKAEVLERVEPLVKELEKRDDKRLRAILDKVLTRCPDHPGTLLRLAETCERLNDHKRAEELHEQAASALLRAGNMPEAEKETRSLLAHDPNNVRLLSVLAQILEKQGRLEEATKTLMDLAERHRKADRTQEAKRVLEQLLRLRPSDADVLQHLSTLYADLGDQEGVITVAEKQIALLHVKHDHAGMLEHAETILGLQPDHAKARQTLFASARALGQKKKAVAAGEQLIALYRKQNARDSEVRLLRDMMELAPEREDLYLQLIQALAATGRADDLLEEVDAFAKRHAEAPDKTIKVLRELLRDRQGLAPVRRRLVDLYQATGRTDDLVAEMQKLIESEEAAGNADEAVRLYRDLLKRVPDSVSTRSGLVALLRKSGQREELIAEQLALAKLLHKTRKLKEAARIYEDIHSVAPEETEALRGHALLLRDLDLNDEAGRKLRELAQIYSRQGRSELAITTLNDILERDPGNQEVRRDVIRLKREEGRPEEAARELIALADALQSEGDIEGSIGARREAISLLPEQLDLRENLIRELTNAGRTGEARIEELALAEALSRAGQHQRALDMIEVMIKRDPDNYVARRTRAKIYDQMGDERKALEEYRHLQDAMDRGAVTVASAPATASAAAAAVIAQRIEMEDTGLAILPEYDFDSYVVGTKNNFAYATAKSVANHPGSARNPLFLYSDVGLGKTHLLHAIANHLRKKQPDIRILYTSTEYFTSELIDAIQNNTVTQFRNKHRQSDLLLLDDVQFLAGKERSQEEFFHIFNMLYQARRQIVVTSDRPPKDISHLDMRLRSRFGQGVIVDIQPPDVETRVAILRAETAKRKLEIPNEVLQVLAERVSANVRELKGAYNQLITIHEVNEAPFTVEAAIQVVEKYFAV